MIDLRIQIRKGVPSFVERGVVRVLAARVRRAIQRMTLSHRQVRVSIDVIGDRIMAELHARHLGEARSTDVLAFSDPDSGGSGDIALNWDAVRRQAAGSDPSAVLHEATSLCIHAVAHLFGHDHHDRSSAGRMLRAEQRIARSLGLVLSRTYSRRGASERA